MRISLASPTHFIFATNSAPFHRLPVYHPRKRFLVKIRCNKQGFLTNNRLHYKLVRKKKKKNESIVVLQSYCWTWLCWSSMISSRYSSLTSAVTTLRERLSHPCWMWLWWGNNCRQTPSAWELLAWVPQYRNVSDSRHLTQSYKGKLASHPSLFVVSMALAFFKSLQVGFRFDDVDSTGLTSRILRLRRTEVTFTQLMRHSPKPCFSIEPGLKPLIQA